MSQRILDNFDYRARVPIDARQYFTSLSAMKEASDNYIRRGLYDGIMTVVDNKRYMFDSANENDSTLGRWREYSRPLTQAEIESIIV